MKKIFVLFLYLSSMAVMAQYSTPGNYHSYTLDDLVAISDGAVIQDGGSYLFTENITISATDTLSILEEGELIINANILWIIEGVLTIDATPYFEVRSPSSFSYFTGIRFDNSSASLLQNLVMSNCGGVKLVDSDMEISTCSFTNFSQDYSTAAIDLFHSNPNIHDCNITDCAGPAIGSGANASSSPQIFNNVLEHNVTSNGNYPQINLGTSDGFTPIVIDGNTIIGQFDMSGGIAVSTLAGGNANAQIMNNEISDNRYGIAMIGSNITAEISHNTIIGNNIQNDPMLGGSGLNFYGGETNNCIASHNIIMDNLWGITIQLNAQPNLGDGSPDSPGHNQFYDNGNGGEIYALYNNTPGDIMALNNFWATTSLAEAEDYIFHKNDDLSLGEVFFDPMWINPVGIEEPKEERSRVISPNPCTHSFQIEIDSGCELSIYNLAGQMIMNVMTTENQKIDVISWEKGCYILNLKTETSSWTEKLIIQ